MADLVAGELRARVRGDWYRYSTDGGMTWSEWRSLVLDSFELRHLKPELFQLIESSRAASPAHHHTGSGSQPAP